MSGPKIDHVELERRKREEIERVHKERLRQIRLATDIFYKTMQEVKTISENIRRDRANIIDSLKMSNEMRMTLQDISSIKKAYINKLIGLTNVSLPSEAEDILVQSKGIKDKADSLKTEYDNKASLGFTRIQDFIRAEQRQSDYESFTLSMLDAKLDSITGSIDFEFEKEIIANSESISDEVKMDTHFALDEISNIINSDGITHKDKKETAAFAKKIINAAFDKDSAITTILTEYSRARTGILQRIDEFINLYQEYIAEYFGYIEALNVMREQKILITPKEKNMFSSMQHLKEEIEILKRLSVQTNEQNYIRTQINEVMQLFGYDLCEDIILDTEQKGHHYLCLQKDGKNAIHVHLSDSKQIMMEVVGTSSRQADNTEGISAAMSNYDALGISDTEKLLIEQGRFCSIHPKITEELRKRGIILKIKAHREPDRKYCKEIIKFISDKEAEHTVEDENEVLNSPFSKKQKTKKLKERMINIK